jgi:hypothetical protein
LDIKLEDSIERNLRLIMEQGYMNLVVSYLGDNEHQPDDDQHDNDFLPPDDFMVNSNYRDRAFSWDLTFENQINNMEGVNYDNGLFVFPRNRSESITALSDIIRGVRSDSFAETLRGRSDSLTDASLFLPLLLETIPDSVFPRADMMSPTSYEIKLETEGIKNEGKLGEYRMGSRYSTSATFETPIIEVFSTEGRVGAYSKEERQMRINRFRDKKKKRVWRKQIKYDCRKRLADTRPRIKGRFVSRKEDGTDDDFGDCIDVLIQGK